MVEIPRRSVTRFFIPLIDVLILLFAIFLLMPVMEEAGQGASGQLSPGEAELLRQENEALRKQLVQKGGPATEELLREITRLRQQLRESVSERVVVRTFSIDPDTGALVYYTPDGRVTISSQEQALALIERDRNRLDGGRELYYLILYPRPAGEDRPRFHPTADERERYTRWFKDVPLAWDEPGKSPGGGT